jgi:Methyltransferase domain
MEFLVNVKKAIEDASEQGLIGERESVLTGFSGEKLVGMLQRFSSHLDENTCYLEVGVYRGLTLLSVAKSNENIDAYGIDNFAFFDKEGINYGIVKERISKLNLSNAHVINEDYEQALENLGTHLKDKKVGVYFIDGPHDYRSQLMCLLLIKPFLAKNAVIIIDDCNYRHVRQANRDFLQTHTEFKLFFEAYTNQHPLNLNEADREDQMKGWWNGVNVIVTDPNNSLKSAFPETLRERTLYENEHAIHSTKHPEVIPFLLKLTNAFSPIVYKFSKLKTKKNLIKGRYKEMNTYSENLVKEKFND